MQSAKMARAMKSGNGAFDVDDFLIRLVTFMGGRKAGDVDDDGEYDDDEGDGVPLQWERIGWKAVAKSHRVPAMGFMCVEAFWYPCSILADTVDVCRLGPLAVEQKTRTTVKRSKLEKHKEDQRKPQQITEDDITRSANETTKNVAAVRSRLLLFR